MALATPVWFSEFQAGGGAITAPAAWTFNSHLGGEEQALFGLLVVSDRAEPMSNSWQTACVSADVSRHRIDRAALEIGATPEELYAAFADPAKLMEWLPPGSMTGRALEYDFRQGGRYRIALTYDEAAPASVGKTEGRTDVSTGRFLTLEPGRRIIQSVEFESTDAAFAGEMRITWLFEPTSAGTKVTITAENVPAGISQADHDAGLRSSLENLARFVR